MIGSDANLCHSGAHEKSKQCMAALSWRHRCRPDLRACAACSLLQLHACVRTATPLQDSPDAQPQMHCNALVAVGSQDPHPSLRTCEHRYRTPFFSNAGPRSPTSLKFTAADNAPTCPLLSPSSPGAVFIATSAPLVGTASALLCRAAARHPTPTASAREVLCNARIASVVMRSSLLATV
jgi:hypothetical protein